MSYEQQLQKLASELVTPEREFPPRTPHTYAHLAKPVVEATVTQLYPDAPEMAKVYEFPPRYLGSGTGM